MGRPAPECPREQESALANFRKNHLPERQWRKSWESATGLPNFKPSVQGRAQRLRLAALWLIELGERKVPMRMPAVLAMSVCPVI